MKIQKKGDLASKERNRGDLHELDIAENKRTLSKLRTISTMHVGSTIQEESDSDLATHIATAYETSFLRRAQMQQ
jgi:hypothetical protein